MDLETAIAEINALSNVALQHRWRKRYRRDPPTSLPPKLMRDAFIYALQEERFGGLSAKTRRRLVIIAAKVEADPKATIVDDSALRPGARLIRDWRGRRYDVEVLESGFGFKGSTFQSLSEIARLITGTRWSGPRFFGLKDKKPS